MGEIVIQNEHLAWKLYEIARRENRSLTDTLVSLLAKKYPDFLNDHTFTDESVPAVQIRLSHDVDISYDSSELLENAYQAYLKRQLK